MRLPWVFRQNRIKNLDKHSQLYISKLNRVKNMKKIKTENQIINIDLKNWWWQTQIHGSATGT
jgi:hypothetical protein